MNADYRRFARHAADCDPRHSTYSGRTVSVSLKGLGRTQDNFELDMIKSTVVLSHLHHAVLARA